MKRYYSYEWEKLYSAVRCLVGYGERRERFAHAIRALDNTAILRNPKSHLPKEIRDEYVELVKKMSSKVVEVINNGGLITATVNNLDDAALGQAEEKIITFYDTVCRYQEPFGEDNNTKITKKQSKPPEEFIAYHEAGHAVMAFNKGARFEGVSVSERVLKDSEKAGGVIDIKWPSKKGTRKNKGRVLLAGMAAVAILRKCPDEYCEDRNQNDRDEFFKLWKTKKTAWSNLCKLYLEAVRFLTRPNIWKQVEIVATTLLNLKTLMYEQVQLCIESLTDEERKRDFEFLIYTEQAKTQGRPKPRKKNKRRKSRSS